MEDLTLEQLYKFNKHQTPLTEELKNSLPREVWLDVTDFLNSVEFIKRLVQPEEIRGFAKDRPRNKDYDDGRIEVDIVNPHILEDMDYFRERAIYFEKNGKYTHLLPNPNPKSDYGLFWKNELHRWKHGLVRESDGEWISGELYFYWNYAPIWLVEKVKGGSNTSNKSKGERKRKFAKPWLGDYLFHHYVEQAKRNGKHGKMLKTRGIGAEGPNSEPILTPDGFKTYGDINVGDYLVDRKGNPTKVLEVIPQGVKDVYEVHLKDGRKVKCGYDHLWSVYDKSKQDKRSLRTYKLSYLLEKDLHWFNKNGNKLYKYFIPDLEEPVKFDEKELKIPPYVLGALLGDGALTGTSIRIATDDFEMIDNFKLLLPDFEFISDPTNNNFLCKYKNRFSKEKSDLKYENSQYGVNWLKREIKALKLDVTTGFKFIPDIYKTSSVEQRFELIKGLLDTDGSISHDGFVEFSNSNYRLIKDVEEVLRSLNIKCTFGLGRSPKTKLINGKLCNIKQEYRLYINTNLNLFKLSRKSNRIRNKNIFKNNPIVNIVKLDYQEESTCFIVDNDEHIYLTTDFVPTHNSFKAASWSPRNMFVLPGSGNPNFHLASDKGFLSGDKGIWGKILDTLDWIGEHTPLPRLRVVDDTRNMYVQLGFKDEYGIRQGLLSSVFGISLKDAPQKARGIRGPLIHYEEDGLFPNLEEAWNINRKAVEDGDVAFGFQIAMGTGGTQGASFEGSEKLFYNGEAYNIYTIPNVFDKNAKGDTTCGFFWGSYLNRNGCYEENNGEPDVIKALIEICTDRFKVKYNSSDPNAITQKKAEECITPQEAIMRTEGTVFPVSDLKEYLESIMIKREAFVSEHYIGDLIRDSKGKVIWKPNADIYPLRSYDKDTGNKQGCVEIFQQPKTNQEGVIPRGRYIAGIDPIDADTGTSLFSCQIMDLFTDEIVAEYTGRPRLAEDAYEIAMRLLEYYNAECNYESNLKGLFNYFDKKNKLYLLCDTPQILRDMQYIKATNLYGNKSKGTNANKEINKWGRVLQAQWMQERKYPDNQDDLRLKLHTLRGIAYIEECIKWNSDGNFDRVSAGNMLFVLREDRHKMTISAIENQNTKIKQLHDDLFFTKNYDKRYNKNAIKTKDILFN